MTNCSACEHGYYQTKPASSKCIECQAGYYCEVSLFRLVEEKEGGRKGEGEGQYIPLVHE